MENFDHIGKLETEIKDYITKSRENLNDIFFQKYKSLM